jgi:hypothetical protein
MKQGGWLSMAVEIENVKSKWKRDVGVEIHNSAR